MDATIAGLFLTAVTLLILYFVVRKAVHHGILDAEESRREAAAQIKLHASLSDDGAPTSDDDPKIG
jgi:hypothetical protein